MALWIENPEADSLARELAQYTGESVAEAVIVALRERLTRERHRQPPPASVLSLGEELLRIGRECAALPVTDTRTPDEILGYGADGLPT